MPDLHRARHIYVSLRDAWDHDDDLHLAFTDLDDYPEDSDPGFNWMVGYLTGVADALGWSTEGLLATLEESDE